MKLHEIFDGFEVVMVNFDLLRALEQSIRKSTEQFREPLRPQSLGSQLHPRVSSKSLPSFQTASNAVFKQGQLLDTLPDCLLLGLRRARAVYHKDFFEVTWSQVSPNSRGIPGEFVHGVRSQSRGDDGIYSEHGVKATDFVFYERSTELKRTVQTLCGARSTERKVPGVAYSRGPGVGSTPGYSVLFLSKALVFASFKYFFAQKTRGFSSGAVVELDSGALIEELASGLTGREMALFGMSGTMTFVRMSGSDPPWDVEGEARIGGSTGVVSGKSAMVLLHGRVLSEDRGHHEPQPRFTSYKIPDVEQTLRTKPRISADLKAHIVNLASSGKFELEDILDKRYSRSTHYRAKRKLKNGGDVAVLKHGKSPGRPPKLGPDELK
ncbi:hypothetical protein V8E36_008924 [Tilletia maclaganii]